MPCSRSSACKRATSASSRSGLARFGRLRRPGRAAADERLDPHAHLARGNTQGVEGAGGHPVAFDEQAEEQVLSAGVVVAEAAGLLLGEGE